MKIVSVIPLKRGILKGDLTYFTNLEISVGNIVTAPIRGKTTLALVISLEELKQEKSNIKGLNFNLRKITENKGPSVFLPEFIETIFEASRYFAQNRNNAIASLIPSIFTENYDKIAKIENVEKENLNQNSLRAEKLLFQYPIADRISIYKTLIRESFARGKSIFLVLPTELDIGKFGEQLAKGIEQFTFEIHSGLSSKKNLTTYEKIITSKHPVLIIGTPPFLSIPRTDIGTIILEHENSGAYHMLRRPYFDLRIFTEIYAFKINAKFILADEMLRYETIARKELGNLPTLHPLSYRIDFAGDVKILNTSIDKEKQKNAEEGFQILKNESLEAVKTALELKKNVFIFSLRKGLSTMTVCRDCNETISCEQCGAPLVLYLSHQGKKRMLVCNRCAKEIDGDTACSNCGSWNLMPLGIGTDTVLEEVERNFPKVKIFKLDKESAVNGKGAKKIIEDFEKAGPAILIGTEMAFFYIKDKIPLSVVASLDSLWSIPNYKMGEKIGQLLLSITNNTKDLLIIQTKNPHDEIIKAIESLNLLSFARNEIEDRRKLLYPPFKRFIKITHLGDKTETLKARKILGEIFAEYSPEIFSGFIARLKGKYVTNALLKINPDEWSLPDIFPNSKIGPELLIKLQSLPPSFQILVDPEDLL